MVGLCTRPAIERAGTVTPHLQRGAPDFYPNEAVAGPNGPHAAARIGGRQVLIDEVVIWAALFQGAAVRPDGTPTDDRTHPLSPAQLRRKLEAVLRRRPLDEEIREMVQGQND
jgi:hypothetical protein